MERIIVFDTTLRDGEQSPGATMTTHEKVRMARALEKLGVDVLEAGFPVSSPDDFRAVRTIGEEVQGPIVAALARAHPRDVDTAAEALASAARPRIHVFLATSPVHLARKLRISEEECVEQAVAAVRRARRHTDDVEFSAEDATRTPLPFLTRVVQAVIEAGATTVNLPDTVGYAHPSEIGRMISTIRRDADGAHDVVLSVHCHDDLGLATANTLAGIEAGARQVECTVNGIGERAGNAALEEIVMALQVRSDLTGAETGIDTTQLYPASRLLARLTGIHPQPNKAIVGRNAFAHEAGIHQDGVLKEPGTYEIMDPRMVGIPRNRLVLGKHSGRHALKRRYAELGHELEEEELKRAYAGFKELADRKKEILDEDLIAILHSGGMGELPEHYSLESLDVRSDGRWATASVTVLENGGFPHSATCRGDGPIAAAFGALDQIVEHNLVLEDLTIRAATPGRDAAGEVNLRIRVGGVTFTGRGVSTDVVAAAVRAHLHALNKAEQARALEARALQAAGDLWGV
jgi:2-isopropylmalate synthase